MNFAEDDDEDIEGKRDGNFLDAEHSSSAAEASITWSTAQNCTMNMSGSQASSDLRGSTVEETQETTSHEYPDTSMAKSSRTKESLKVDVMLMVALGVEGPDVVTIRKG